MNCTDCNYCDGMGCSGCRPDPRLPRYQHCDQCGSDHDVTLVEYDALVDGLGYTETEWLCRGCRDAKRR